VRRYVLWLRLQRAVAALSSGRSVTDAAYAAGFSDAAHLSRTFRRMLGCPPRDLVRRQKQVRDVRVDDHRQA
jgi:AraC-like DNA-binding protein